MNDQDMEWFETFRHLPDYQILHKRPIAYFCTEFAISDYLQTYAGGLGVLAGDMIREASDQKIPLVAVGLYYRDGYFHHEILGSEVLLRNRGHSTPEEAGLTPVVNPDGSPLFVQIPIENRIVYVQAWRLQVGSVSIYLLDTSVSQNDEADKHITDRLYVGDRVTRLKQEIVLGIGGLRLIEALGIHPSVYHLNEGHSAMLALEIARHEMQEHGTDFLAQLKKSRERIVFSNHTLLPAGNENFAYELVSRLLSGFAGEVNVDVPELIKLGSYGNEGIFSMTTLALNMATTVNAVSKLHAEKAKEIWSDHPMIPITNGIHLSSWDGILPNEDFWQQHQYNKEVLLRVIKEATGQEWGKEELLIGWARRMVSYKRPLAIFEDLQRFLSLAKSTERPIRVVMAGEAHESDLEGAAFLGQLEKLIATDLHGVVVYMPNYRTGLNKLLTTGCDVWLNTPIVGFEACGTSGMKAALNGVLPLTTRDGWAAEIESFGIGWALASDSISSSILDELQYNVVPMYYNPYKSEWLTHMKNARELIQREFSATKMLRMYIEKMYQKSIATAHEK